MTLLFGHSDGLVDFQSKTDTVLNFYTQKEQNQMKTIKNGFLSFSEKIDK